MSVSNTNVVPIQGTGTNYGSHGTVSSGRPSPRWTPVTLPRRVIEDPSFRWVAGSGSQSGSGSGAGKASGNVVSHPQSPFTGPTVFPYLLVCATGFAATVFGVTFDWTLRSAVTNTLWFSYFVLLALWCLSIALDTWVSPPGTRGAKRAEHTIIVWAGGVLNGVSWALLVFTIMYGPRLRASGGQSQSRNHVTDELAFFAVYVLDAALVARAASMDTVIKPEYRTLAYSTYFSVLQALAGTVVLYLVLGPSTIGVNSTPGLLALGFGIAAITDFVLYKALSSLT